MPEPEESMESPGPKKAKRSKGGDTPGGSRSLAGRIERSLKDVDRLMKQSPQTPPEQKAMAQLEQAKISALLQLAESIRESKNR